MSTNEVGKLNWLKHIEELAKAHFLIRICYVLHPRIVNARLQTFSRLPRSWNLALVVAFVENLESTDWHLSSRSIGRTHPHRPGTVLANTTDTDI